MTTKRLVYLLRLVHLGKALSRSSERALMGRHMIGIRERRWVLTLSGAHYLRTYGDGRDSAAVGYWPSELDRGTG